MATDQQLLNRLHRKAATLTPEMRRAYLNAYEAIRLSLSPAEFSEAIQAGRVEELMNVVLSTDTLEAGPLADFRARVIASTNTAGIESFALLPKSVRSGGAYNPLAPEVLDAVNTLKTRVVNELAEEVRETVTQHIAAGLEAGQGPRTIARGIRPVVGLAPNQEEAVRNFRRALEGDPAAGSPFTRKLRDRRFDRTLRKGEPLTPKQIDTMTEAYSRRWKAHNAETQARTFALDAQRQGQRNAWLSAVDDGLVDGDQLTHTWVDSNDDRVRPEHAEMDGETQPVDMPYSNGQMVPGETDFNCRCTERFTVRRTPVPSTIT
jgi:hypothetical protein